MKRHYAIVALLLVTTTAFSGNAWYAMAVTFGAKDPLFDVIALAISVIGHEFGHWIALEMFGVKSVMGVIVVLGWAAPFDDEAVQKLEKLTWEKQVVILFAGPFANLVMISGAFLVWGIGVLPDDYLQWFANLNGAIGFFNLFPLWRLDGAGIMQYVIRSLRPRDRARYVESGFLVFSSTLTFVFAMGGSTFPIFSPLFFYFGLRSLAKASHSCSSWDERAMPEKSAKIALSLYLILMCVLYVVSENTNRF